MLRSQLCEFWPPIVPARHPVSLRSDQVAGTGNRGKPLDRQLRAIVLATGRRHCGFDITRSCDAEEFEKPWVTGPDHSRQQQLQIGQSYWGNLVAGRSGAWTEWRPAARNSQAFVR